MVVGKGVCFNCNTSKFCDPGAFIQFVCVCCVCFVVFFPFASFRHLFLFHKNVHTTHIHFIYVRCFSFMFVDYSIVCSFVCSHLFNLVRLKADTSIWLEFGLVARAIEYMRI